MSWKVFDLLHRLTWWSFEKKRLIFWVCWSKLIQEWRNNVSLHCFAVNSFSEGSHAAGNNNTRDSASDKSPVCSWACQCHRRECPKLQWIVHKRVPVHPKRCHAKISNDKDLGFVAAIDKIMVPLDLRTVDWPTCKVWNLSVPFSVWLFTISLWRCSFPRAWEMWYMRATGQERPVWDLSTVIE